MKILIVDDCELNRYLLKHFLSAYKELLLFDAENGKEALELFNSESADLIFMDIMMPVMNGILSAKHIKEINPNVPIIAITAYYEGNSDKYDYFDAVLEKPISFTTIKKILNKYLLL